MKAIFKTKFGDLFKYNGQIVEILGKQDYKIETRYIIKFADGKIMDNIMSCELNFNV